MGKMVYNFNTAEPGIFVEIYLPKKSYFQGTLYRCLTEGFKLKVVKEFLEGNEKRVREMFSPESTYLNGYSARVSRMRGVFTGYSLYEVDGVFKGDGDSPPFEERTQVVRIMFRPESVMGPDGIAGQKRKELIKGYLRTHADRDLYVEEYRSSEVTDNALAEKEMLRDLIEWEAEVALFLFGFLLRNICDKIQTDEDVFDEEEIWVTSFWNLTINRVTKKVNPES